MNHIEFQELERKRVLKLYSQKKHAAFGSKKLLADWFCKKLKEQRAKCYYCNTSIHDINRLIDAGKLRTRKVRNAGVRGKSLEIDKINNKDGYGDTNNVLACYYCNNDKSYTIDGADYKKHFGQNREKYHQFLLDQL